MKELESERLGIERMIREKIRRNQIESDRIERIRHKQEKVERDRYRRIQSGGKDRIFEVYSFIEKQIINFGKKREH